VVKKSGEKRVMVTGVVLAAGQARRMGRPKQLLLLDGKPMIWHVVTQCCHSDLDDIIVITGAYEAEVKQALDGLPVTVVYNASWVQGQSTSVKKSIETIKAEEQAILFLLADQPLVDKNLINSLVRAYRQTTASIIIPRCKNRLGNPVLFDIACWRQEFLQLSGDEGARKIFRQYPEAVQYVELLGEHFFLDIDTPTDYENMKQLWQILRKG
jgi:molybdenum cofactor cytidylyltransferase